MLPSSIFHPLHSTCSPSSPCCFHHSQTCSAQQIYAHGEFLCSIFQIHIFKSFATSYLISNWFEIDFAIYNQSLQYGSTQSTNVVTFGLA